RVRDAGANPEQQKRAMPEDAQGLAYDRTRQNTWFLVHREYLSLQPHPGKVNSKSFVLQTFTLDNIPTGLYAKCMNVRLTRAPGGARRRILRAAFEEFYKHGFQGGSLNQIVKAAGATKGALFHHFEGKHDLGYAVLEELIQPCLKAAWFEPIADSMK